MRKGVKIPMRREAVFGKGGGYSLVVEKNILLHEEAARAGMRIAGRWVQNKKFSRPVRVLDLACGGAPVIPNAVMQFLAPLRFDYTGIDINAGQVETARRFTFAANVKARILEGDAWALEFPRKRFDWIFIGLNTHHAIPEELDYLARRIRELLEPGGLFMNHDKFRPSKYRYLPRPEFLSDKNESMRLVPLKKLRKAGVRLAAYRSFHDGKRRNWREALFKKFEMLISRAGSTPYELNLSLRHVRERDFPVSAAEMRKIFMRAGFQIKIVDYAGTKHPLKDYFRTIVAYA